MAQNTLPRQPGALLVLAGKCEAGLTAYATPLNITQITPASLAADAGALVHRHGRFQRHPRQPHRRPRRPPGRQRRRQDVPESRTQRPRRALGQRLQPELGVRRLDQQHHRRPQHPCPNGSRSSARSARSSRPTPRTRSTRRPSCSPPRRRRAWARRSRRGWTPSARRTPARIPPARRVRRRRRRCGRTLRALIGILNLKLTPNDARWAAFGLNAPGAAVTPKAPTNVQSFPALAGQIHATCDTPAGTDHFRWFVEGPGQTGLDLCDGHGGRGSLAHRADERADRAIARDGGEPGGRERAQRGDQRGGGVGPIGMISGCSHGTPLPCGRALCLQNTATECRGYSGGP